MFAYLSEYFLCLLTSVPKRSKLLFPVFNLSKYPSEGVTLQSKLKESRILIISQQKEPSRCDKVDGIWDFTYNTNYP